MFPGLQPPTCQLNFMCHSDQSGPPLSRRPPPPVPPQRSPLPLIFYWHIPPLTRPSSLSTSATPSVRYFLFRRLPSLCDIYLLYGLSTIRVMGAIASPPRKKRSHLCEYVRVTSIPSPRRTPSTYGPIFISTCLPLPLSCVFSPPSCP